ncbi:MAG: 23S rRNA (pseudouridine(1915)-N(3))-methyltransferase RlmH [Deltaproteobacteria bacterium]
MRLQVAVVGRLKSGPEFDLWKDYIARFGKVGRPLGLPAIELSEVEDKTSKGMSAEAILLSKVIAPGAFIVAMDERGAQLTSPEFAQLLADRRDAAQDVALVIGGADGIAPDLRAQAGQLISFGRMVWPHMLARVMLAEQLYRAATILAGSPYHRV